VHVRYVIPLNFFCFKNLGSCSAGAGISLNSPGDFESPGEFKLIPAPAEHKPKPYRASILKKVYFSQRSVVMNEIIFQRFGDQSNQSVQSSMIESFDYNVLLYLPKNSPILYGLLSTKLLLWTNVGQARHFRVVSLTYRKMEYQSLTFNQ
jgi:hypothetical protein